tara:strand:- start:19 stop:243 length:225 start_codon:yes stop_codon:yes gene_type:complete
MDFTYFDDLLVTKTLEIETIIDNKKKKNIIDDNIETLNYDVKKIISKQKTHEFTKKQKSKSYKNKQLSDFINNI